MPLFESQGSLEEVTHLYHMFGSERDNDTRQDDGCAFAQSGNRLLEMVWQSYSGMEPWIGEVSIYKSTEYGVRNCRDSFGDFVDADMQR